MSSNVQTSSLRLLHAYSDGSIYLYSLLLWTKTLPSTIFTKIVYLTDASIPCPMRSFRLIVNGAERYVFCSCLSASLKVISTSPSLSKYYLETIPIYCMFSKLFSTTCHVLSCSKETFSPMMFCELSSRCDELLKLGRWIYVHTRGTLTTSKALLHAIYASLPFDVVQPPEKEESSVKCHFYPRSLPALYTSSQIEERMLGSHLTPTEALCHDPDVVQKRGPHTSVCVVFRSSKL